jgi:copper chaperone CopZ
MHCTGCEQRVTRVLEQLPNVKVRRADFQQGEVEVRFNSAQASLDQIRERIEQAGYQVER